MNDNNIIPMEWEYIGYSNELHNNIKNRIYNRVAPNECFKSEVDCISIERQQYFENCNGDYFYKDIIDDIAVEWCKRPYCWICYKEDLDNKNIIEHEHDNLKKTKDKYPGKFRARACSRCNRLEAEAKKIYSPNERFEYWANKNNWISIEERNFFYNNLKKMGYLDDYYTDLPVGKSGIPRDNSNNQAF